MTRTHLHNDDDVRAYTHLDCRTRYSAESYGGIEGPEIQPHEREVMEAEDTLCDQAIENITRIIIPNRSGVTRGEIDAEIRRLRVEMKADWAEGRRRLYRTKKDRVAELTVDAEAASRKESVIARLADVQRDTVKHVVDGRINALWRLAESTWQSLGVSVAVMPCADVGGQHVGDLDTRWKKWPTFRHPLTPVILRIHRSGSKVVTHAAGPGIHTDEDCHIEIIDRAVSFIVGRGVTSFFDGVSEGPHGLGCRFVGGL